jgi:hypothetical protein
MAVKVYEPFFDRFQKRHPRRIYDGEPPETVRENTIVDGLTKILETEHSVWVEREVNLWELNQQETDYWKPEEIIDHYGHPLQPDIDILYGPLQDGERYSPLVGIEVKHFSYRSGTGNVLPKTRLVPRVPEDLDESEWESDGGYYTGLDQAMALLQMGLDYVILVHLVDYSDDLWEYSDDEDAFHDAYKRVTKLYSRKMTSLIDVFDFPIGYVAAGADRQFSDAIASRTVDTRTPDRNPLLEDSQQHPVRQLFHEALDVTMP